MNITPNKNNSLQMALKVAIILALSVAFFLSIYRFDNKYTAVIPEGRNGLLDLNSDSLSAHPVMFLIDGWEYYGGRLLSPEDFSNSSPTPDQYIFIGQFGGFERWNNGIPHGSASYRLTIRIPEVPDIYLLELPEIFSAYRLYVNGKPAAQMGIPEAEHYRPETGNQAVTIEAGSNVELLFAVSDYSHLYSGITYPPAFGRSEDISRLLNMRLFIRSIFCASVLTIGLLSVMVGLLARRNIQTLLYGLLCLTFVGYAGYPLIRTLTRNLPAQYMIENLCFCLMLCLVILITLQSSARPKKYYLICLALGGIMSGFTIILHLQLPLGSLRMMMIYSRLVSAYQWITAIAIATTVWGAVRKGMVYLEPLLYGAVILGCALIMDRLLPLHEPILIGWFIELASFSLILCIGIVTGYEVADQYRQSAVMKERAISMELLYSRQLSHFQTMKQEIEQTKTMRHDIRHHITIMDEYVKKQQYGELETYLQGYHNMFHDQALPDYCPINVINILTHHYHTIANQNRILLDFRCNLDAASDPGSTDMTEADLCALYSNLMENAVEACMRIETDQKTISVAVFRIAPDILNIHIRNSAADIQKDNDSFLSSKRKEPSGYGLISVESIAKKYNGKAEFIWNKQQGEFESRVTLSA